MAGCVAKKLDALALTSLEARILLVDHVDLAAAAHNLSARLVLQRPKGIADLHRALLSVSSRASHHPLRVNSQYVLD